MNAADLIVNEALKTIWIKPDQDLQHIFQPARMSTPNGVVSKIRIGRSWIALPNTGDGVLYHIYQIGLVPAVLLNVEIPKSVWTRASTVSALHNVIINGYIVNGKEIPLSNIWILITNNNNILIAVNDPYQCLSTNDFYIRMYSNAYYSGAVRLEGSDLNGIPSLQVAVYNCRITNANDMSTLYSVYNTYMSNPGYTIIKVNGYVVTNVNVITVNLGDYVELVYDPTIAFYADVPLSQLVAFPSTLDSKQKFLLSADTVYQTYNKTLVNGVWTYPAHDLYDEIWYLDDNDYQLLKAIDSNNSKGLYYHKNAKDSVRMVTHRDYSIPVAYVQSYIDNGGIFTNQDSITVRILIRFSGSTIGKTKETMYLSPEVNNIKELYRLRTVRDGLGSDYYIPKNVTTVRDLMVGAKAVINEWKAENLENSVYVNLMRRSITEVTPAMAIDAFGYEAGALVLANPIQPITGDGTGNYAINIPPLARPSCTIFIYNALMMYSDIPVTDANTTVIDNTKLTMTSAPFTITNTEAQYQFYNPIVPNVYWNTPTLAEVFIGQGTEHVPLYAGVSNVSIPKGCEFRCYVCPIEANGPTYQWVDVTGTNQYFVNETDPNQDIVEWSVDNRFWYTAVKTNTDFLCYDLDISSMASQALYKFSIDCYENHNGTWIKDVMRIPPAKLELFSIDRFGNRYRLTEGIQYFVNWSEVCIVDCHVLNWTGIMVRCTGFADVITDSKGNTVLSYRKPEEAGLIKNSLVSTDGIFEIRDRKPHALWLNGSLFNTQLSDPDIAYPEFSGAVHYTLLNPVDFYGPKNVTGRPYCFDDYQVPLIGLRDYNLPALKAADENLNTRISQFYSTLFVEPQLTTPAYIVNPTMLFSPFMAKVISDVVDSIIDPVAYSDGFTVQSVTAVLQPYMSLLQYDPAKMNNLVFVDNGPPLNYNPGDLLNTPLMLGNAGLLAWPGANVSVTVPQFSFINTVIQIVFPGKFKVSDFCDIIPFGGQ